MAALADANVDAVGAAAKTRGMWYWRLPNTPNGLQPSQCWHSIGSSPSGAIYVGGMDHSTNSALYRIYRGQVELLGDAKSAAQNANDWQPGETAQKFHTRPLWHNGNVYVATLDQSSLDDQYLYHRGFHWYRFNEELSQFTDLGVGAEHGGLVTLVADPSKNTLYGASIPTSDLYMLDLGSNRTKHIGRPSSFERKYVYTNRFMWSNPHNGGALYITAGNPDYDNQNGPLPQEVYGHVHGFNPDTGLFFENRNWKLVNGRALELGQCVATRNVAYFVDDLCGIYRYTYQPESFEFIGKPHLHEQHHTVWSFNVADDGKTAYIITTCGRNRGSLFEVDLETAKASLISRLADLDPVYDTAGTHTGSDSWDLDGNFYFSSFATDSAHVQNVLITRLNPKQLKAAL
jgi:hypothetical protein